MDRWQGKVAIVTGASSGIGADIAVELVKRGIKVVAVARRVEKIEALKEQVKDAPGQLYPMKGDIIKEQDILAVFDWTKTQLGGVDILINNAGVGTNHSITENQTSEIRKVFYLNVLGLSICTREAVKSMRERGVDDGHIIHINSIAGHSILNLPLHFYTASKHAVTVLTEGLRRELVQLNSHIRVTSVNPGNVETEFVDAMGTMGETNSAAYFKENPFLASKDISDAVIYTLSTPPHVQGVSTGAVDTDFAEGLVVLANTKALRGEFVKNNPILESKDIIDAVIYTLNTPTHVQIHEIVIRLNWEKFLCTRRCFEDHLEDLN